jgi:tetratricopeptide (TPR) repeat protein
MKNKLLLIPVLVAFSLAALPLAAGAESSKNTGTESSLSAEVMYKFLVAEIAGQRGDIASASAITYDLAKSTRDPRLADRATREALYIKQLPSALRAATLWVELDPDSVEARQTLLQLLLASGKTSDMRPYLQKLLADEANRPNTFLSIAGLLSRSQDKAGVYKLMQDLAKPYPTLPEAHFALAHAAWSAGKEPAALAELKTADQYRPGWEIGALLQGQILLQAHTDDALAFYRDFLESYPNSQDVRLAYATALVNAKQLAEAKQQFDLIVQAKPNDPNIQVTLGLLSIQLEDSATAEASFKHALDLGYKDADQLYFYLGQITEQTQREEEAQQWYDAVPAESRFYFETQVKLALLQGRKGQVDEAVKRLQNLPGLNTDQLGISIQTQANILSQANRYQEAYDLLEQGVQTLPSNSGIIYDYAMTAERLQHFDVMERELRKLILIKPDFAQAYNALGYTLADRNERLDEAQKLIEKALALTPNDHFILDSMGWVEYRLGKLDKAVDFIRRAYDAQSDPEIAAHLGEVLWQQGKHDEAVSTWDDALRQFPDNEALINTAKKFKQ